MRHRSQFNILAIYDIISNSKLKVRKVKNQKHSYIISHKLLKSLFTQIALLLETYVYQAVWKREFISHFSNEIMEQTIFKEREFANRLKVVQNQRQQQQQQQKSIQLRSVQQQQQKQVQQQQQRQLSQQNVKFSKEIQREVYTMNEMVNRVGEIFTKREDDKKIMRMKLKDLETQLQYSETETTKQANLMGILRASNSLHDHKISTASNDIDSLESSFMVPLKDVTNELDMTASQCIAICMDFYKECASLKSYKDNRLMVRLGRISTEAKRKKNLGLSRLDGIAKTKIAVSSLKDRLQAVEEEVTAKQRTTEVEMEGNGNLEQAVNRLTLEQKGLAEDLQNNKMVLHDLKRNDSEAEKEHKTLMKECRNKIETSRNQKEAIKDEIKKLESSIITREKSLEKWKCEVDESENRLQTSKLLESEKNNEIMNRKKKMDEVREKILMLEREKLEIEKARVDQENVVKRLTEETDQIDARNDAVFNQLGEDMKAVKSIRKVLPDIELTLKNENENLSRYIASIQSNIKEKDSNIAEMEKCLEEFELKLQSTQKTVDMTKTSFISENNSLTALRNKVEIAANEISNLTQQLQMKKDEATQKKLLKQEMKHKQSERDSYKMKETDISSRLVNIVADVETFKRENEEVKQKENAYKKFLGVQSKGKKAGKGATTTAWNGGEMGNVEDLISTEMKALIQKEVDSELKAFIEKENNRHSAEVQALNKPLREIRAKLSDNRKEKNEIERIKNEIETCRKRLSAHSEQRKHALSMPTNITSPSFRLKRQTMGNVSHVDKKEVFPTSSHQDKKKTDQIGKKLSTTERNVKGHGGYKSVSEEPTSFEMYSPAPAVGSKAPMLSDTTMMQGVNIHSKRRRVATGYSAPPSYHHAFATPEPSSSSSLHDQKHPYTSMTQSKKRSCPQPIPPKPGPPPSPSESCDWLFDDDAPFFAPS